MKTNRFLFLAASLSLAMAFTSSCSSEDRSSGGQQLSDVMPLNKLPTDNSLLASGCTAVDNTATHYCSNGVLKQYGSFTYSGQTYKTVVIGTQTWMAENLNYNVTGSKCYDNLTSNCNKYGRLYTWAQAANACPSGWHLPSNAEWDQLLRYVDGSSGTSSIYYSRTAARFLKAISTWNYCRIYGNPYFCEDTYGFSALAGGWASALVFLNIGEMGSWWTSNSLSDGVGTPNANAYLVSMAQGDDYVDRFSVGSNYLHSVRCIKN